MSGRESQKHEENQSETPETLNRSDSTKTSQVADAPGEIDQIMEGADDGEFNASNAEPRLDISREQSPETADEAMSNYTDSAPGSPGSENESSRKQKSTISLDTSKAVVKNEILETNEISGDHVLATTEKQTKRVTARSIEKQWTYFENEQHNSFEKICAISMNSVLERYTQSKSRDPKVAETQRILTQHWLSDRLPKSFRSRLKVTKLPPPKSLVVKMRGARDSKFDPLSIDQVSLRRTVFETYLSAEKKQLESLEAYKNSLQKTYDVDFDYLNDFKKTTATIRGQNTQERTKSAKDLHLDSQTHKPISFKLLPKLSTKNATSSVNTHFDPEKDDDLRSELVDISNEIRKLDEHKNEILDLCDKLDIIERQLYARSMN